MENKLYCMKCGFVKKYKEKEIIRAHMINGKEISCVIKVKVCCVCGEELSSVNTINEELEIFREK